MVMNSAVAVFILLIVVAGTCSMVGPILWAVWQARRTLRRSKQFSLWNLLFAFTIVTLIMGAFAAVLHGTN
jgi:hypothetical protein